MMDYRFAFLNSIFISRERVVQKARRYTGVPYTHGRSVVFCDENHEIVSAKLNCLGFVLQVAKDCEMLPEDFNINGPRFEKNFGWEETMQAFLDNNFTPVPIEESGPGDILKMRYADIDKDAPLHVAIKTTWENCPSGRIIHAINRDFGSCPGCVVENRLDINEQGRILSAHKFKGIFNG